VIAEFYQSFFVIILLVITFSTANDNLNTHRYYGRDQILSSNRQMMTLMVFVVLFIGLRPVHPIFADTMGYVMRYENEIRWPASWSDVYYSKDIRNEWLWHFILMACARLNIPSWGWLTLVAFGYVGCAALAIKKLFKPNHTYIAFIFFISSFSFFSYAVNGMRNGLSVSIVLLAFSYLLCEKRNIIKFLLLAFIAYNIHHSAMLPLACMLISYYALKNTKIAFLIWVLSIPASLFAHGFFESLLISISPDERLADNIGVQYQLGGISGFSKTGFRWDFVLYSIMPIILGYYVVIRKKVSNNIFTNLLNTYLMCNAFWILVIRASFSNRFAYLSWFIYPIVLAYPLLELEFEENQRLWISRIMIVHTCFTAFMHFIFYA